MQRKQTSHYPTMKQFRWSLNAVLPPWYYGEDDRFPQDGTMTL